MELLLALAVFALGAAVLLQPDGAWAEAAQQTADAAAQHADALQQSTQAASQEESAGAGLLRFLMVRSGRLSRFRVTDPCRYTCVAPSGHLPAAHFTCKDQ